jgi:hypothetical protein
VEVRPNRTNDAVESANDFVIPEPQDAESPSFNVVVPRAIMSDPAVGMLRPIEFDHEASFEAHEIDCVRANRNLPAELVAAQLASTQAGPQQAFRVCRIAAKVAGEVCGGRYHCGMVVGCI